MSGRRLNHQGFSSFLQNNQSSSSEGGGGGKKSNSSSTTKEIARKAVEDEWKRNQKRKRSGHGGGSSDEEDDDRRDRGKFQRKQQKTEEDEDDSFEFSQDYRDRAKERREGMPPADTAGTTKEESTDPMDPELPAPTKGLDLSLARKLRKEMQASSHEKKSSDGPIIFTELPTMEQATSTLESIANEDDPSLDSRMISSTALEYIRGILKLQHKSTKQLQTTLSCSLAGKKLQRSRLVVNLHGKISDLKRSWEIPREVTNPHPSSNNVQEGLDLPLIRKIGAILKPTRKSHKQPAAASSSCKTKEGKLSQGEETTDLKKSSASAALESTVPEKLAEASEEDDDDIFGGLDDYMPPAPKAKQ